MASLRIISYNVNGIRAAMKKGFDRLVKNKSRGYHLHSGNKSRERQCGPCRNYVTWISGSLVQCTKKRI